MWSYNKESSGFYNSKGIYSEKKKIIVLILAMCGWQSWGIHSQLFFQIIDIYSYFLGYCFVLVVLKHCLFLEIHS